MRASLLQMTASDAPPENARLLCEAVAAAKMAGAEILLTPEVSNCVSTDRAHQHAVLRPEAQDETLAALRAAAAKQDIWVLLGSLALCAEEGPVPFVNRSFLIDPAGAIRARYDKMHMFDVSLSPTESYRESSGYAPGDRAVLCETPWGLAGLTICYDLRFPHLYRALAQAGAEIIFVPSAFSVPTGQAHWETLLRARAIENGCFILAPAQTGLHPARSGKERTTYGHTLAVGPWGEVIADAGELPGLTHVTLDLDQVKEARKRVPSLGHDRDFALIHHQG